MSQSSDRLCQQSSWRLTRVAGLAVLALASVPQLAWSDLTIGLTYVGSPGNTADDTGHGAVSYSYYIGTYEITVAQYAEFLNTKAQSDPYGLYSSSMGTGGGLLRPIITRSGSEGSYTYSVVPGTENQPVRYVSFYDGIRLCNWLGNGQGAGDTENGAYDLSLGPAAVRQSGATWVVPTEDEWYKAAYYDPVNDLYYNYPHATDAVPPEPTDGVTLRLMNFGDDPYWAPTGTWTYFTDAGTTTGRSSNGTWDQGGGVEEWTETFSTPSDRVMRGGSFVDHESELSANSAGSARVPSTEGDLYGFRVAYIIPEPGTFILVLCGLAVLLCRCRR